MMNRKEIIKLDTRGRAMMRNFAEIDGKRPSLALFGQMG